MYTLEFLPATGPAAPPAASMREAEAALLRKRGELQGFEAEFRKVRARARRPAAPRLARCRLAPESLCHLGGGLQTCQHAGNAAVCMGVAGAGSEGRALCLRRRHAVWTPAGSACRATAALVQDVRRRDALPQAQAAFMAAVDRYQREEEEVEQLLAARDSAYLQLLAVPSAAGAARPHACI
jgi:hypothetical protein